MSLLKGGEVKWQHTAKSDVTFVSVQQTANTMMPQQKVTGICVGREKQSIR